MMGNRGSRGGIEFDAFSRYWRTRLCWQRGMLRWVKRQFSKRQRRDARQTLTTREDAR